ncbi:MAG TPA: O-antigen ligase family protein [Thermomicrobiaceae bacterium]|nr:O-antigen ligase family protein [Thermomicrobiaceae bacterium]
MTTLTALGRRPALERDEQRIVVMSSATLLLAALLYAPVGLPGRLILLLAIVAAGVFEPVAPLIALPAALGLIYHPVLFRSLQFNPAEILLVTACASIGLRAAAGVIRDRSVVRRFLPAAWESAKSGFGPIAIAWLALGVLSLFTLVDPAYRHDSIRDFRWTILEPVIYLFLLRWYLRRPFERKLTLVSYVVAAALVALYGLAGLARGHGLDVEGVVRIAGTFPHPNDLALYLERPVVAGIALAFCFRSSVSRWWLVPVIPAGGVLVLTFSRGALVGAAVAAVVIVWLGQRHKLAIAAGGVCVAGGVALAGVASGRILNLASGGSGSMRIDIWHSALLMIRDHPIFGIGPDQFLYQYAPRYIAPQAWSERFTSHPHNLILDIWLRLGIMGLVVAVLYVIVLLRRVRRLIALESVVGLAAFAVLLAGTIHGMVDNGYFLPGLALAFWLCSALIDLETGHAGAIEPLAPATRPKY